MEEGESETDEATLLETVAGDEDSLAVFLTGRVLVTEAGTFLILDAEEEEAADVFIDLMDDDEDPSISKLMSSREMVSLLRMMLDFALDWRLDLR